MCCSPLLYRTPKTQLGCKSASRPWRGVRIHNIRRALRVIMELWSEMVVPSVALTVNCSSPVLTVQAGLVDKGCWVATVVRART